MTIALFWRKARAVSAQCLQIAIDGPAASGKTTVARIVADELGILYLDTGAMYRALTLLAEETQIDLDNEPALLHLLQTYPVRINGDTKVYAGDRELSPAQLTSAAVTAGVSTVAAHARVREQMVQAQRQIAQAHSVVMAGRDIATVVLPRAQVKIFLTASLDERTKRRALELRDAGIAVDQRKLREEIEERDRLDRARATSPLQQAPGATLIDSSGMSAQDVAQRIIAMARACR